MRNRGTVLRLGISRGVIELRQAFTGTELIGQLFWPVVTLAAIFLLRHHHFHSSHLTLGALALPSVLGMFISFGMLLVMQYLTAEREDGTLLRARATPNGIRAYLIGKLTTVSATILIYLAILIAGGVIIIGRLQLDSAHAWLTLTWVLALGLVATQPIGAILGSLISTPRGAAYMSMPVIAVIAISGIFYPISAMPAWLRVIAQLFPVYWLGLGMRSAMLPSSAANVELGHTWHHLATLAVLTAWATIGLVLAPMVLRRMAQRESGSSVTARREKLLQRVR